MNTRPLALFAIASLLAVALTAHSSWAQATPEKSMSSPAMSSPSMQNPPSASEHKGDFGGHRFHKHSLKAIMEKLGITDDQKKQFRGLYVGFQDRTRKTRMELKSLKDEKMTMLLSGKVDQQKLAQIDDQYAKLKSDLIKEKLKLQRDRLALLTPQQMEKMADWIAEKEFRHKMKKMHKKHEGGGFHF